MKSSKIGLLAFGIVVICAGVLAYISRCANFVPQRQTKLFVEIWRGDTNQVVKWLTAGADPNGPSTQLNRPTPLIDAARLGQVEVVKILLKYKADPNRGDRDGFATLYYVLHSPFLGTSDDNVSPEIIRVLLEHGADISGKGVIQSITNLPPNDPRSPLCAQALENWNKKRKM